MKIKSFQKQFRHNALTLIAIVISLSAIGATAILVKDTTTKSTSYAQSEQTVSLQVSSSSSDVNEDGSNYSESGEAWIGNGGSTTASYTGFKFNGLTLPKDAQVTDAYLEVYTTKDQWISIAYTAGVSTSTGKPSQATLLPQTVSHTSNVKWSANTWNSLEKLTPVFQSLASNSSWTGTGNVMVVLKGSGSAYGRKYIASYDQNSSNAPRLTIKYKTAGTTSPTVTSQITATPTKTATLTPTGVSTATPTKASTSTPTHSMTSTPTSGQTSTGIFGVVSAELLGTCSQAVHDKYVVTGPDGVTYRTWHPAKDPSGCTFAHEHGDNPGSSTIYSGTPVAFGYIAKQIGMDEPHAGFKCFVHNQGTRNDEGGTALHNSYYCFHMGTGGAARFTQRFHSLDFHIKTTTGAFMNVQGMADIGNVGTICDNPRQQRTVMGFGCKVDSSYEIWENVLKINNRGNVVATAISSTAVFDAITVMDPTDKTKAVYAWDPAAQSNVFKFNNDRTGYRGCDREAYSGPVQWYNRGGSQVYYTDVYGNVVNGGPLKQEISTIATSQAGTIDQYGGLIMAYKGGTEAQLQFKYRKSACVPGLGIKN